MSSTSSQRQKRLLSSPAKQSGMHILTPNRILSVRISSPFVRRCICAARSALDQCIRAEHVIRGEMRFGRPKFSLPLCQYSNFVVFLIFFCFFIFFCFCEHKQQIDRKLKIIQFKNHFLNGNWIFRHFYARHRCALPQSHLNFCRGPLVTVGQN